MQTQDDRVRLPGGELVRCGQVAQSLSWPEVQLTKYVPASHVITEQGLQEPGVSSTAVKPSSCESQKQADLDLAAPSDVWLAGHSVQAVDPGEVEYEPASHG